jgi:hypothetical protein
MPHGAEQLAHRAGIGRSLAQAIERRDCMVRRRIQLRAKRGIALGPGLGLRTRSVQVAIRLTNRLKHAGKFRRIEMAPDQAKRFKRPQKGNGDPFDLLDAGIGHRGAADVIFMMSAQTAEVCVDPTYVPLES